MLHLYYCKYKVKSEILFVTLPCHLVTLPCHFVTLPCHLVPSRREGPLEISMTICFHLKLSLVTSFASIWSCLWPPPLPHVMIGLWCHVIIGLWCHVMIDLWCHVHHKALSFLVLFLFKLLPFQAWSFFIHSLFVISYKWPK